MTDEQWQELHARCIGAFVNGDHVGMDRRGERILDDRFMLLLNGHHEAIPFTLPPTRWGNAWQVAIDTFTGVPAGDEWHPIFKAGDDVPLEGRSVVLLRSVDEGE
jgi:glycogen operon protein